MDIAREYWPLQGQTSSKPLSYQGHPYEDLARYMRPVESRLLKSYYNDPSMVYAIKMGNYEIGAVIPQVACEAVGGDASEAVSVAYSFSLGLIAGRIFDDLIDKTVDRGGTRTLWKEFGEAIAIPLGCQLLGDMFEALESGSGALEAYAAKSVKEIFRKALIESSRAEKQEKLFIRTKTSLTFPERLELATAKRGTLISAAAAAGAIAGGGSKEEVEALRSYGMDIGTADQLINDSIDSEYPDDYRKRTVPEVQALIERAVKSTDRLGVADARAKLIGLCRLVQGYTLI